MFLVLVFEFCEEKDVVFDENFIVFEYSSLFCVCSVEVL